MKVCLLGYGGAGKKTLFELLTGRSAGEGRREGVGLPGAVALADARLDAIARAAQARKTRRPEVVLLLAPDVEPGSGKRPWLEALRESDLAAVMVRAFSSADAHHPRGSVDPERDRRDLDAELALADLEVVEKRLERQEADKARGRGGEHEGEEKTLHRCREALESGRRLAVESLDLRERAAIQSLQLVTFKSLLWIYNVDEDGVKERSDGSLALSAWAEKEIAALEDADERGGLLAAMGVERPVLERFGEALRRAAGLVTFYTIARGEAGAWLVPEGTPAPRAAGRVHTDMERGFIRVEVMAAADLIACGDETALRRQGKVHLRSREYEVRDGDVCLFHFTA